MNESAISTTATHSSNGDSSNCVVPLLNAETTLTKPSSSSARIDFNANAIVDDRDNLPTDCDDGGSDDDSFGSPLRLGKLVIDFDAGCEPRSQPNRETSVSFMSAPRVADPVTTGSGNCAASLPLLDTMSKVEHQITNTSGNGLQVKIKRKTLVMKPDGTQQPSPVEGQANGNANICSTESKQPPVKPTSNNNDSNCSVAENGSKKDSKGGKPNASKASGGKAAKSSVKSMDVSNIKSEISDTLGQQLQGSRSTSPLTMTITKDANSRKVAVEGVDPYEFNVKVEDKKSIIEPAMKKVKSEKVMDGLTDNISSTCFSTSTKVSSQQLTRDVSVETCSVSVATDPDCLGPCDPGSHVVLEGIVWQETNNGLLVVNVTWRGKTYVGTLMDATQHDWAPPIRLSDFATVEMETKTPKGRGAKRGRGQTATPKNDANERRLRSNRRTAVAAAAKDAVALAAGANSDNNANGNAPVASDARRKRMAAEASSANNGNNGNDNGEDSLSSLSSVTSVAPPPAKQSKMAVAGSISASGSKFFAPDVECAALPPPQFVCSEPGCCKRYQRETALRFHQSSAHPNTSANNASAAAGLQRQSAAVNDSAEKNMDANKKSAISAGKITSTGGSKPAKVKVFAANSDSSVTTPGSGSEANVPMEVSATSEKSLKSNDGMDVNKFSSSLDNNGARLVSKPAGDVVNDNMTGLGAKPSVPNFQQQSGTLSKDSQEVKVKTPKGEKSLSSSDKPKAKVAAIKTSAAGPAVPTTPPAIAPARSTMQLVSVTTHSQGPPLPLGNLKPIQPKPTVMGEPSSINPSLSDLKEMKAKKKKKNKDKDKDREKDRSNKSAASPPASGGEFVKPAVTATSSPPQVRVTPDSETIVIGSSSAPSTPVPSGRQSPGFLSTSAAQDQQNSKVQSPAYSDISDANDSAPSLEQEGAMDVTVGANLSGNSTDTLPLSPPIAVAMGNAADVAAATNRGVFAKGHSVDIAQKPYYNQPPSLLPVISASGGSASTLADTKLQQQGLKSGFNQSKSTPPLPLANQDLQQRMGGLGGMNPALAMGELGKKSSEQHPAKTRTPPNLTPGAKLPSTPSSAGSKQYSADKSGLPSSSARPVGCAYPMHSTPNATAAGAKHERSLSADGHSRPPPMLISDRDRNSNEDPSKAPRDRSSESRQILVESMEMRSQMPGSHYPQQQALVGGSGRVMLASSGGEYHGDFDGKMAGKESLPRARSEDDRGSRVLSRDGSSSGPFDSAKSPQSSTPKPARDVPPPPPLSATGGVVPYPFFPGPGFYPMMTTAGPMEGGVVPVSVDPGMYSMFAASQAAAMAAVYGYGMPVVDNSGSISVKVAADKQQQLASPGSSSMSPDARLPSTSFDGGDSVLPSGSAGMSSHKMKELKDIANKRAEVGGGNRPSSTVGSMTSSTSSSTLLTRPPGALLSPGSGSSSGLEGGVRASPPAQRHVHEHVHHVVPSAPPGFPGLPIYPPFGVGALMPPMHPNIAVNVARMARPTVNK